MQGQRHESSEINYLHQWYAVPVNDEHLQSPQHITLQTQYYILKKKKKTTNSTQNLHILLVCYSWIKLWKNRRKLIKECSSSCSWRKNPKEKLCTNWRMRRGNTQNTWRRVMNSPTYWSTTEKGRNSVRESMKQWSNVSNIGYILPIILPHSNQVISLAIARRFCHKVSQKTGQSYNMIKLSDIH